MAQNTPKTNAKHKKRPQKTPQYKQPDILSALATSITSMSTPSSSSLPDWIFVDKHRVLSPHLRNCIYCKRIRTQNMEAHVDKHKRAGEKPRPDEARRQFDESIANAKQYIQKNKAAFSTRHRNMYLYQ